MDLLLGAAMTLASTEQAAPTRNPTGHPVARAVVLFAVLGLCACAGERPTDAQPKNGASAMTIELTSSAFREGEIIPKPYTGDGKDQSPPLRWADPPAGTKSFALIADDPDAPRGTWVHWVLFNLPAETRELKEGVPTEKTLSNGAKQGTNDFKKIGYGGPAPPPGKPHRYFFKLYALDTALDLAPGATKDQVVAAMEGHVKGEGQLMGKYGR
jgi:Raf kinase inhibitor-like YbhB/YbcL family protein